MPLWRKHWFYPYAVLSYGTVLVWLHFLSPASSQQNTAIGLVWVAALLVSFQVCYRPRTWRQGFLRCFTLGGSGVWLAQETFPGFHTGAANQAGWLRGIGVFLALLFEGAALLAMLRCLFGRDIDPAFLEKSRMPPLVITVVMAEARF